MYKQIATIMVSILGCCSIVVADSRDLPGIDLITREQRGANESRKRADSGNFDRAIKEDAAYQQWLQGIGVDRGGKFAAKQKSAEIKEKRKDFFLKNYPDERNVDDEITVEAGHDLRWAQSIKEHKTKLIIHHTAGSERYDTKEEVLSGLQAIYKYHTIQHGWGDIGYNFLIDPFGNIYEGRAGGPGVIAAHADYNNNTTLGIALLGNFDVQEPTPAMMSALLHLLTVLAWQYDIAPYKQQPYFTAVDYDPYILAAQHDSIVGHQDTKNTACPGDYVYAQIPQLKRQVAALLSYFKQFGKLDFSHLEMRSFTTAAFLDDDAGEVSIPLDVSGKLTCMSVEEHIAVAGCKAQGGAVILSLVRDTPKSSGVRHFVVSAGANHYLIDVPVVRQDDIKDLLIERRAEYIRTFNRPSFEKSFAKVEDRITTAQATALAEGPISVLLYELTAGFDTWEMACTAGCTVTIDGNVLHDAGFINVVEDKTTDQLYAFVDLKKYTTQSITIASSEPIEVTNYERSGGGGAQNRFRGALTITKGEYKHLDYGVITRYLVINTLPFADYLAGIGETSEAQHTEKLKAMALLVKTYALFYMTSQNPHPSIPVGAPYTAVDDPRIFQKYVGAAREDYGTLRQKALADTKDIFLTYHGMLPILPYFHCSAGFTWSAAEKFGWTDTPWLPTVLDVAICPEGDFDGHGVGLSGVGAQKLAEKGVPYKDILQYYYPGITVQQEE